MLPVIIPFFKNKAQLAKCQDAVGNRHHFHVVDDSEVGSGFTKTVNRGLKEVIEHFYWSREECHGEHFYALILNQDCYLKPDAIEKMVAFMDSHPKCAIAGIKQLSSENEDVIIHGGTLECFPAGRHEGGRVSRGDCAVSKQVPWVNGACMIVRLDVILEIGLMDENMKMFGSDADWSYTARARGWECWYVAEAACIHEQGVSKSMDAAMEKVFEKDMLFFRDKWLTGELYRDLSLEVLPVLGAVQ
jgi:GT2 family glycosyltransferase